MKTQRKFATRARVIAACLAGALTVAACGSSETTDGARDRNVNVGIAVGNFGDPATGIARTRLGDIALRMSENVRSRRQADGSWLAMVESIAISSAGFESVYSITRVNADGSFDDAFGTDGVVTIRTRATEGSVARLTQYGQVLVLEFDSEKISKFESRSWPARIKRFDATTGDADQGFVNGELVLDDELRNSVVRSFDGGTGDSVVILSSPFASPTDYTVSRVVNGVRDRMFGGIFGGEKFGSVTVPVPSIEGARQGVRDAVVNLEDGGTITALFAITKEACLDENTPSECAAVPVRRGIGVQQLGPDGSIILKMGEETGDGILWIDDKDVAGGIPNPWFEISDVSGGSAIGSSDRYVTVAIPDENRYVYRTSSDYARFDSDALVTPIGFSFDMVPNAEITPKYGALATYLPMEKPMFVGSLADPSPGGSYFWSSTDPTQPPTYGPRIGDYPYSFLRLTDLQTSDSGTFANISTLGVNIFSEGGLATLWSGRGYAKFDAAGQSNALFNGADRMTRSPLDGLNPFASDLIVNTGLLAGNGDFFYTAAVQTLVGGPPTLQFQRYDASGGAGASRAGDPIVVTTDDIGVLAFGHNWVVSDGKDAVYLRAIRDNRIGVAKALLSKGRLDESYGEGGFAPLGSIAAPEPGGEQVPESWFDASLQLNADGSIDAITSAWLLGEPDSAAPVMVTTRRIPADGNTDLSIPAITVVTDPELIGCECVAAIDPDVAFSISVDPEQRIVIGTVDFEHGEGDGALPETFVRLIRYATDGVLDSSFGSDGSGEARIVGLPGLMELPPTITPRSNGEYLVGYASLDASLGKGGEIIIDGQYLNVARVSAKGEAIDFTTPAPNPIADKVADLINSIPAPNAPTGGIAALPAADQPAVSATNDSALVAALPADAVLVSPDNTLRITLATSVADRAIDVSWSVPAALVGSNAKYVVTATPGGQRCTTSTTSCVFKKLDPWTAYTFSVSTLSASSGAPADSLASNAVKPVRIVKRGSRTKPTKLIKPASTGKQTWKATGGCKVTKDGKTFSATKDAGLCTLSLTTAKAGKVPKTTRTITVVVRAVAK